jgi:lipoprotein NlpI
MYASAYNIRGLIKYNSDNANGSLEDFNKSIELNSKDAEVYVNRGFAKYQVSDYKGACADWTKARELGSKEAISALKEKCK